MTPRAPAAHFDRPEHRALDRAALRLERMRSTANFRDGRFWNPSGAKPALAPGNQMGLLRDWIQNGARRTPPGPMPMVSPVSAWRDEAPTDLRATWLGHSTVLLEIDGARILTDPVWADRASPTQAFGPLRFHRAPVSLAELPPLDAIVVSHDHYDHLDADAVGALARRTRTPFFTALGVGAHLERFGVPAERITELAWWEQAEVPRTDVVITATPAQHFSGRGPFDRNRTLWAGWALASRRHKVFFSGDTGLEPAYPEIARRCGPFDLIMLEVGAYHPAWGTIHLGPDQAVQAHAALGGGAFLPVHWGTFDLALHAWDDPILSLEHVARESELPLVAPLLGEARVIGDRDDLRRQPLVSWWRDVVPA